MYICIYIYIYMCRERERYYIYIYIYVHTYVLRRCSQGCATYSLPSVDAPVRSNGTVGRCAALPSPPLQFPSFLSPSPPLFWAADRRPTCPQVARAQIHKFPDNPWFEGSLRRHPFPTPLSLHA